MGILSIKGRTKRLNFYIIDIVEDLFSYNTVKRKRILEYYFFEQASLSSPIMSTEGVMNIQ